ncbi:hypothetical protein RND71_019573 [Anisodus tanguticus]|uniref:Uncharacterized protein n=1 Tax=Anisodus tanguticus TaxID=243964 RepID=A0AAE1S135_9SOLA|nr:hypothetical protein RND71_019573 [Anisodus tanguticus]
MELSLIGLQNAEKTSLVNVIESIHGIGTFYVVDAADHGNLSISKSELHELLNKPSLSGIPLLVLGNKIDKPGALSKQALTEEMGLKYLTDRESSLVMKIKLSCRLKELSHVFFLSDRLSQQSIFVPCIELECQIFTIQSRFRNVSCTETSWVVRLIEQTKKEEKDM